MTTYVIRTFGGVLILSTSSGPFVPPQNTIHRTLACTTGKRTLVCASGIRTLVSFSGKRTIACS